MLGTEPLHSIRAAYVLEHARSAPIPDGMVVWKGARIVAVGPARRVLTDFPGLRPRDLSDRLILPGLINAHDHGRGLGTMRMGVPDAPLELWLPGLYAVPTVSPGLIAEYEGLIQLSVGITTTVHQHNPGDWRTLEAELLATAAGYARAGLRACVGLPLSDRNALSYGGAEALFAEMTPAEADALRPHVADAPPLDPREMIDIGRRLGDNWHDTEMTWLSWGPVGPQWCSDDLLMAVRAAARPGEGIHIHLAETRRQVMFGQRAYGTTPARHLRRLGFLGPDVACAHCVWLEDGDRAALADSGAFAVVNPSSNLRLQSGRADLRALRAAGVRLALGLDGQTLNDDQDIWAELRLARGQSAEMGGFGPAFAPDFMLDMVGTTAAAAVGGPVDGLGRLSPGGPADLIAIDLPALSGPWLAPEITLVEAVLARAAPRHVTLAVVAGEIRFDGRDEIKSRLAATGARIAEALEARPEEKNTAARARLLAQVAARFYRDWNHA